MPWTCRHCTTEVETDDLVCPICDASKTSWSLVAETTRTFTMSARRFQLLCGESAVPVDPENPDRADALVAAEAARVVERDVAQGLPPGTLPAPRDVLTVRLFPRDFEDLTVGIAVEYDTDEAIDLSFPLVASEVAPADQVEDGAVDVRFLFVCGGSAPGAAELAFEGIHVVDLSEDTPEGYAPSIEVTALKKRPEVLPVIPDESCARRLCLRLIARGGAALAGEDYVITFVDGERSGTTDEAGALREGLPAGIDAATLVVAGQTLRLLLDQLDPLEEGGVEGGQARLQNLGYELGPVDGDLGDRTRTALEGFQADNGLEVTGAFDATTRERLQQTHGC